MRDEQKAYIQLGGAWNKYFVDYAGSIVRKTTMAYFQREQYNEGIKETFKYLVQLAFWGPQYNGGLPLDDKTIDKAYEERENPSFSEYDYYLNFYYIPEILCAIVFFFMIRNGIKYGRSGWGTKLFAALIALIFFAVALFSAILLFWKTLPGIISLVYCVLFIWPALHVIFYRAPPSSNHDSGGIEMVYAGSKDMDANFSDVKRQTDNSAPS